MQTANATLGLVIQWGSSGWTGGPNYVKNIALAIAALPPQRRPRLVFLVRPEQIKAMGQYENVLSLADDVRVFEQGVPLDDIDLFYPAIWGMPLPARGARAYWIADFQHCHLPGMFQQAEIRQRNRQFTLLAQGKDMVVLSSQTALDDFKTFFPVSCPTHLLRFATSPEPGWIEGDPEAVKARYGIEPPYLMCCNQFWAHKDHQTLFTALGLLRQKGIVLPLVCTGSTEEYRNPDHFPGLLRFLEQEGLAGQVKILGLLDRNDQIQLLRGATAVVQPSLFEGWSTVIEDCRLLGKTVVYSDIPVHKEQAIPRGTAFRAGDPQHLAEILEAAPNFAETAGTDVEREALAASKDARLRFGLEIAKLMERVRAESSRREPTTPPPSPAKRPAASTDLARGNCFTVKGTQWYAPPLAGATTLAAPLFDLETYKATLGVLKRLADDDYLVFLRGFMARGMKKFGVHWRYADICTVLHTLANDLQVENYLEIGVRQGRSMAMVVSQRPEVLVTAFDMWLEGYADMDNPGPEFVREQMRGLGHRGSIEFVNGNSHETLPRHFADNNRQSFDLITVDGDHSPSGAAADLRDVLPHLRIGGALVFDDIAHPRHPELHRVWRDEVMARPNMSGFEFTELGYGVAFAVRMF